MKKEDIKIALNKITPREELIESTLERMAEKEEKQSIFSFFSQNSFSYRLATAVCSLILVVGIGFALGRTYTPSDITDNSIVDPQERIIAHEGTSSEAASPSIAMVDDTQALIAAASSFDSDWVVVNGCMDAYYFLPLTESDSEASIAYRCIVNISSIEIADYSLSSEIKIPESGDSISAEICFNSQSTMQTFVNAMNSKINLHLIANPEGSDTAWQIMHYVIYKNK